MALANVALNGSLMPTCTGSSRGLSDKSEARIDEVLLVSHCSLRDRLRIGCEPLPGVGVPFDPGDENGADIRATGADEGPAVRTSSRSVSSSIYLTSLAGITV